MKTMASIIKNQSYHDQLKDPRWKQYSKRIREENGNFCQICKRGDLVIQVHHWFYDGRELWLYNKDEVIVLCKPCHDEFHEALNQFRQFVFSKMTPQVFRVLNGALAVGFDKYEPLVLVHAIAEFVSNPSMVERYAKSWNMSASKITAEEKAYGEFKMHLDGKKLPMRNKTGL